MGIFGQAGNIRGTRMVGCMGAWGDGNIFRAIYFLESLSGGGGGGGYF